ERRAGNTGEGARQTAHRHAPVKASRLRRKDGGGDLTSAARLNSSSRRVALKAIDQIFYHLVEIGPQAKNVWLEVGVAIYFAQEVYEGSSYPQRLKAHVLVNHIDILVVVTYRIQFNDVGAKDFWHRCIRNQERWNSAVKPLIESWPILHLQNVI